MKDKIVKIIENYLDEDIHGKQNTVHKVYFDSIAQEIVKLFAIPVVSNSASELEEKQDMEDFGNYAGIGFDDD